MAASMTERTMIVEKAKVTMGRKGNWEKMRRRNGEGDGDGMHDVGGSCIKRKVRFARTIPICAAAGRCLLSLKAVGSAFRELFYARRPAAPNALSIVPANPQMHLLSFCTSTCCTIQLFPYFSGQRSFCLSTSPPQKKKTGGDNDQTLKPHSKKAPS